MTPLGRVSLKLLYCQVGPPALVDAYNSQLDALHHNCSHVPQPLQAETFLRHHLQQSAVRVAEADLPVFILRPDGSLSST